MGAFFLRILSLGAVLWVAAAEAQGQDGDSTLWAWPEAEVHEALSYIRILPHDLSLRTDYVKRDPWRLNLVDQVMSQPQTMPVVMQEFAGMRTVKDEKEARLIRLRCRDIAVKLSQTFGETRLEAPPVALPGVERTALTLIWANWLAGTIRACADTTRIERILRSVPPEHRALFLRDAIELVTEDEQDRTKPAEVLDSLQRAEDTIAAHMAKWAGEVK